MSEYSSSPEEKFSLVNNFTQMDLGEKTGRVYKAVPGGNFDELISMLDYMKTRSKLDSKDERFQQNILAGRVLLESCLKITPVLNP